MTRALLLLAMLTAPACATITPDGPLTGSWGGRHVGLVLTETGGQLDYDCASGTIDGPLLVQPNNRFAATGRHTPGTGGPDQVGQVRPSYPARYSGSVNGKTMMLRVELQAQGTVLGPYSLRRGTEPQLLRCL